MRLDVNWFHQIVVSAEHLKRAQFVLSDVLSFSWTNASQRALFWSFAQVLSLAPLALLIVFSPICCIQSTLLNALGNPCVLKSQVCDLRESSVWLKRQCGPPAAVIWMCRNICTMLLTLVVDAFMNKVNICHVCPFVFFWVHLGGQQPSTLLFCSFC